MKCPKCHHEPTMTEMKLNPGTCPSCGVIYEKYIQALKRQALLARQQNKPAAEVVTKATSGAGDQSQQVVITDIRMNFISMVIFMVKWAFAAIPAMIIIFLIVGMMGALFTGVVAGFMGSGSSSPKSSVTPSSHVSQPSVEPSTQPDRGPLISAYLIEKGFNDDPYQPANTLKIKFENNSGKDVVAFEGIAELKDLLGNTVKKLRIADTLSKPAPAGFLLPAEPVLLLQSESRTAVVMSGFLRCVLIK